MVALAVILLANAQQPKLAISQEDFAKLFAETTKIGQKLELDDSLASFFYLKGASTIEHSHFDSERQIIAATLRDKKFLVFVSPEKPFPEFGKVWVYRVDETGEVYKGGVCDLRPPYKALSKDEAFSGAKKETDYWFKELVKKS